MILRFFDSAGIVKSYMMLLLLPGFGMLESGIVSLKNEVNIMMKNLVDVVLGGFTYWAFGYGLSYGQSEYTNPFIGFGSWFVDAGGDEMGPTYVTFLFQLSFATTATTIVSGAIAERCPALTPNFCKLEFARDPPIIQICIVDIRMFWSRVSSASYSFYS